MCVVLDVGNHVSNTRIFITFLERKSPIENVGRKVECMQQKRYAPNVSKFLFSPILSCTIVSIQSEDFFDKMNIN